MKSIKAINKSFKDALWRKLCQKMHLDWTLPSGIRLMIRSYADWCTYNEIFASGEYDQAISRALARTPDGEPFRVLDLGANCGYFALRFLDQLRQRHGANVRAEMKLVEGLTETSAELSRRMDKAVPDGGQEWKVFLGLAGRKEGAAVLRMGREGNTNFVGAADLGGWEAYRGTVQQSYIDLDALTESWEAIDLVKCDIEGSEFDFIASYPDLLRRCRSLVIEFHPAFGDVESAKEKLRAQGFSHGMTCRSDEATSVYLAWC